MLNNILSRAYAAIHERDVETLLQVDAGALGDFGRDNRSYVEEQARDAWVRFKGASDA